MTTVTEQIEAAITKADGSVRDALNVALAQRDTATALLKVEQEQDAALSVALEAIRALLWLEPAWTLAGHIDKIAGDALKAAGETP